MFTNINTNTNNKLIKTNKLNINANIITNKHYPPCGVIC